ncbi:MAG: leucine-rich repeat domain-containing protein [Clostridia bacterium]|nr:leucine-rich repeat domain-containing protein [Clostridia bacterium]
MKNGLKWACAAALAVALAFSVTAGVSEDDAPDAEQVRAGDVDTPVESTEFDLEPDVREEELSLQPAGVSAAEGPAASADAETVNGVPVRLRLEQGQTFALDTGAPGGKLSFKSSVPKVAKADEAGVITARAPGNATITCFSGGEPFAACEVTVGRPDGFIIEAGVVTGYTGEGGDIVIPSADDAGNTVTRIGKAAFMGNRAITGVLIPAGVTRIGKSAFEGCAALEFVQMPGSVEKIGESAFKDCDRLLSMDLY